MAESVDALVLETNAEMRVSSTLTWGTKFVNKIYQKRVDKT